jgi:hypothetical protein
MVWYSRELGSAFDIPVTQFRTSSFQFSFMGIRGFVLQLIVQKIYQRKKDLKNAMD